MKALTLHTRTPDELMQEAIARYQPGRVVALTSGGGDSTAALLATRPYLDLAAYIDTGTALPGVREHVEAVCNHIRIPLTVLTTPWSEYEAMVLGHGFPGPAQHQKAYIRLKERRLYDLTRSLRTKRGERFLFVTGVRQGESTRRMSTTRAIQRDRVAAWVAPIIDWDKLQVQGVVREAGITPSEVSALIHRSGECNCGAFAAPGEREMLSQLWPEWWEKFAELEAIAATLGVPATWGGKPGRASKTGPLCHGCDQGRLAV